MACSSQSMLSANTYSFLPNQRILQKPKWFNRNSKFFSVNASSSSSEEECNVEECAPEKEVGKLSMDWKAEEKTKVSGTFPPKKKGWTGYVEKDTAGQTNIYSVEPAVYVAESAISSGAAGTSSAGAENTAGLTAFLALIAVAAASSILLQVGKNAPEVQTAQYSGPPLSYYVTKFKPVAVVEAVTVAAEPQTAPPVEEVQITGEASESSVSSEIVPEAKVDEVEQSSSFSSLLE